MKTSREKWLQQVHINGCGCSQGYAAGYAEGLRKAVEIVGYHRDLPMRNEPFKAACRDIKVSLEATIFRITLGHDDDPSTEVGGGIESRNDKPE